MLRKTIILVFSLLSIIISAHAKEPATCESFQKITEKNQDIFIYVLGFTNGFISHINSINKHKIQNIGTERYNELGDWLSSYCQRSPSTKISEAAEATAYYFSSTLIPELKESVGKSPNRTSNQTTKNEILFDIPAIMKQSKDTVNQIHGQPEKCENSKHGLKCYYAPFKDNHGWTNFGLEIMYINHKADWISIDPQSLGFKLKPNEQSLARLGFQIRKPDFKNEHLLSWKQNVSFSIKEKDASKVTLSEGQIMTYSENDPNIYIQDSIIELQFHRSGDGNVSSIYLRSITP